MLKKGLRLQVGNGKSVKFWEETWIPELPSFKILSLKPADCNIILVSDAIVERGKFLNL